jgi:hypothetical protein
MNARRPSQRTIEYYLKKKQRNKIKELVMEHNMPSPASGNRVLRIGMQRRVRIPPGAQECQRSWHQGKRVPIGGQKAARIPPGRQRRKRIATGGQGGGTKIREVQGIAAMIATMAIAAETAADFSQLFEE